ncbi:hypothetical protein [Alienimonas sp. DA493]|uniref:hypothetical protein n=1 Tax=Alienimonas sp. DA493 TaxID=3373605 RepID=UPI00375507F7
MTDRIRTTLVAVGVMLILTGGGHMLYGLSEYEYYQRPKVWFDINPTRYCGVFDLWDGWRWRVPILAGSGGLLSGVALIGWARWAKRD